MLQWLLLLSPLVAQAVVPVVPFFSSSSTTSFSDLLPLMPNSQSQAWMLGKLEFALSSAENSSTPNAEINEILASAAKIVNRRNVTVEELHSVLSRILESESHKGIYEHVVGFFSFVNIVWLVDLFCYLFSRQFAGCHSWYLYLYYSSSARNMAFPEKAALVFMEHVH